MEAPQPPTATAAAMIGDVIASRQHPDRGKLEAALQSSIRAVNSSVPGIQPLATTIGDEFQGLYRSVEEAVDATLYLRLHLLGVADVRFGIGWGAIITFDPGRAPYAQDGPAWWNAREAIGRVARSVQLREHSRGLRTVLVSLEQATGDRPVPERGSESSGAQLEGDQDSARYTTLVNAFLICRDEIVSRLDARDGQLALALLAGESLSDMSRKEGITSSAVSQRAHRKGLYALRAAGQALRGEGEWLP